MRRILTLTIAALACSTAMSALPAVEQRGAGRAGRRRAAPLPSLDPVIDWNRFLLDLQATPGDQPATVHPTYELAMVHAAIYDAVSRSTTAGCAI